MKEWSGRVNPKARRGCSQKEGALASIKCCAGVDGAVLRRSRGDCWLKMIDAMWRCDVERSSGDVSEWQCALCLPSVVILALELNLVICDDGDKNVHSFQLKAFSLRLYLNWLLVLLFWGCLWQWNAQQLVDGLVRYGQCYNIKWSMLQYFPFLVEKQ